MSANDAHVPPGLAPGRTYLQIVAEPGGHLLKACPMWETDEAALADADAAGAWLIEHGGGAILVFVYDGDTGDYVGMNIIANGAWTHVK